MNINTQNDIFVTISKDSAHTHTLYVVSSKQDQTVGYLHFIPKFTYTEGERPTTGASHPHG